MPSIRPDNLPDFQRPPIYEVAIGVQFEPTPQYQQILAHEIWALYRADFPHVEYQRALPPSFETFGRPQSTSINIDLAGGATHDRFWFLSPDKQELIQFQPDRLLHNWRKVEGVQSEYPRFEKMIEKFTTEIGLLADYFKKLGQQEFVINQCEITYINHIPLDGSVDSTGAVANRTFKVIDLSALEVESLNFQMNEQFKNPDGKLFGRLHCKIQSAYQRGASDRILVLELTVRGAPETGSIASAISFLEMGRSKVVQTFAKITTEEAHKIWGRVQ